MESSIYFKILFLARVNLLSIISKWEAIKSLYTSSNSSWDSILKDLANANWISASTCLSAKDFTTSGIFPLFFASLSNSSFLALEASAKYLPISSLSLETSIPKELKAFWYASWYWVWRVPILYNSVKDLLISFNLELTKVLFTVLSFNLFVKSCCSFNNCPIALLTCPICFLSI